ncbi:30S ribosome-binding factor RbfA [Desulfuribacillus alkaliarsenatis]|uniref:Ribosome-binding factor A n=1 Tax=Desulfuribacillus alkaliarsenatis TaxID=766136 RepID=A0A1E5G614_9FIRM|nr:30S ribosome-binding factor RbfA [Desulfuribacillus alkaliarsenatis]OEF98647.1 ribosome-binding factor A [Desulfuribacillus alkaliarsenatis]
MANVRVHRVAEQIKKEVSQLIQNEIKDPRIGFITVTDVEVTGDLQQATIFISILGNDSQKQDSLDGLKKAQGFIRRELGRRIRLRHTPEIVFSFDSSIEYGNKIERILSDIKTDILNED